jgi:hypothetical protein
MSKGEKEKDNERKIKSINIGGATPKGDTIFHRCQRGIETSRGEYEEKW